MSAGPPKSNPLVPELRAHLAAHGPESFAWFMEQALYHPAHGYYASGRAQIGRRGDYFTSVSVGPLFGRLLARQFTEMWERLGRPRPFVLVEQGAHDGWLARDVLAALRGPVCAAVEYRIIEPFPALRHRQQETLAGMGGVTWSDSLEALEPFTGVHFSNELLDAFPVHLLVRRGQRWLERQVAWEGGRFVFVETAPGVPVPTGDFPEGYLTEARPAAVAWLEALEQKIVRGFVLIIDYGWTRDEFLRVDRPGGTLTCCAGHRQLDDPLADPGGQDLGAHVEFTSLIETGERLGLSLAGFTDQHHFITALGVPELETATAAAASERTRELRAFRTLMHPDFLGTAFKVLCLAKAVPPSPALEGFRFAVQRSKGLGAMGSPQ